MQRTCAGGNRLLRVKARSCRQQIDGGWHQDCHRIVRLIANGAPVSVWHCCSPHGAYLTGNLLGRFQIASNFQDGFIVARLSVFSLMTALLSGSVYAAPTRSVENQPRPGQTQPVDTEMSCEMIEKRNTIAEARRNLGSQLSDNR